MRGGRWESADKGERLERPHAVVPWSWRHPHELRFASYSYGGIDREILTDMSVCKS